MKRRFTALLALVLSVLLVAGCSPTVPMETTTAPTVPSTAAPTTVPSTTEAADARDIYHQFLEQMPESITMDITMDYVMDVAGFPFTSSTQQQITYWDRDTDAFRASVEETFDFGDHLAENTEVFYDGIAYAVICEDYFYEEMTAEDFTSRYLPVALLDETLYETVTMDGDTITFTDATELESWLIRDSAEIVKAEGTVTVSGNAITVSYLATYTVGGSTITVTVQQSFREAEDTAEKPANADAYQSVESIDGFKLLDNAFGYLLQAQQFSSTTLVSTQSQAAGMVINQQYHLDSYMTDQGTDYSVETNTYAMDSSETFEQDVEETYIGGKYTMKVDDGDEQTSSTVTAQIMSEYVLDILYANIFDNDYLTGASVTDLGSLYLVEFTCHEDLATSICESFSETYLGDADILNRLASKYQTNQMDYYVAVDKYTLLPTACGYLYEGCHTIEGYDYLLIEQLDQSFDLASMTSHDAIYDAPAPDTEPEEKPTPLFYQVTGPDGQQMWLFGTIHVGDDRTAYLPQEIYDALLSSDALAVECDTEGFDEALEDDDALQDQVSDCYFYNDGTVADHLDTEDLHEDAVKVMKATGSYFYNTEYMKASLWSSSIDNYYLSQAHQLVSEKGLESRLEAIAEENDIPLWEVESSMFQIQMMTGYSDYLQEFLLYSSAYSHGKDSWEGVKDLYELWCAGDEAALIEEMKRESWAFTEEDLEPTEDMDEEDLADLQYIRENLDSINTELEKIYNEYIKSMESDRNAGMLEVAKGYLESGDTVFFAVGLAHLIAEDGLVFTLREAGYTVELVPYN